MADSKHRGAKKWPEDNLPSAAFMKKLVEENKVMNEAKRLYDSRKELLQDQTEKRMDFIGGCIHRQYTRTKLAFSIPVPFEGLGEAASHKLVQGYAARYGFRSDTGYRSSYLSLPGFD